MKANRSILYLDDRQEDAELIRRCLKALPFRFRFVYAKSRKDFIKKLESTKPDVILVDYQLQDYDGLSAIRDALHYHPFTPVIVVTGSIGEEAAVQCIKAGAADFVLKDQRARLVAVIDNILEQWKARRELKESEEKYRSIFIGAYDGFVVVDRKGTILEVNPAFERMTGLKSAELVGKSAFYLAKIFLDLRDLPRIITLINDTLMGIPVRPFEIRFRNKILEISIPHVANIFGKAAIIRDVTEQRQTAEQIRISEARYRDLVENTNDLICTHDLKGRLRMVNRAVIRTTRYSEKTLLSKSIQDLLVPEVRNEFEDYIRRLKQEGKATGLMKVRDRYGKQYIWEYNNTLKTDGPEPLVRGIAHDITKTYEAIQNLKFNEARYRDLVENSNDLIYLHDLEGNLTWVNKAVVRILGYSVRHYQNINIQTLIQKPYLHKWKDYLQKLRETHQAKGYVRLLNRAGKERILEYQASLQSIEGQPKQVRGIARDVTERMIYEEQLRVREAEFRTLYENATIGLYRTTPDGTILLANPSLVKMLGYDSFDALRRRNLEKEGFEPGYDRSEFKRLVERKGGVKGLETVWYRSDGTPIQVRENARAIRDNRGNILFYEGTVEDVTEWKTVEVEKDRLFKHQKAVNRLSLALGQVHTTRQLYRITYQHLKKNINVGALFISRYDPDQQLIIAEYAVVDNKVMDPQELPPIPINPNTPGIQSRAIYSGEPVYVADWGKESKKIKNQYHVKGPGDVKPGNPDPSDPHSAHSGIVVPMKISGLVVGLLNVQSIHKDAYSSDDITLLSSLGNVLAVALENIRLLNDIQRKLKEKEKAERSLQKIKAHLEERVTQRTAHLRITNRQLKMEIRERQKAEIKLQSALARIQSIIESPKDVVIFSLDRKYRYIGFNQNHSTTMKAIWGVDISIGENMLHCIGDSKDRRKARRNFDRALKGESFTIVERYGAPPNRYYYENMYSPILATDGKVIGLTVFLTDVTERLAKDEELRRYREELEQLVQERTTQLEAEIRAHKQAQAALARSHDRYQLLFEESPVSLWEEDYSGVREYFEDLRRQGVTDLDAWFDDHPEAITECVSRIKVLNVNQATLRMYGVRSKEELLIGLHRLGGHEFTVNFRKDLVTLFNGEYSMVNETEFPTPAGKTLSIIVNRFIPPGYKDSWRKVLLAVEDFTDRKRMEEELKTSREQYRLLTETAPLAVVGMDESGLVTIWNSAAVTLFGYSPEEAVGQPFFDLITPEDARGKVLEELDTFIQSGSGIFWDDSRELTAIRKNGEEFPVELSISAYRTATGWQTTGIIQDLTRRKRDRAEIERLAALVHHSADFISITDMNGNIVFVNEGGRHLVGLDRDPAELHIRDFLTQEDADYQQKTALPKVLEKGQYTYQTHLRHFQTGKQIPVLANFFLLTSPDTGEPYAIATVQRDITELNRARRNVEENLEELRLLQDVNTAILNRESFQSIIQTLAQSFHRLVAVDLLNFYIFTRDRSRLMNMAQIGSRPEMKAQIKRHLKVKREEFVPRLREGSRFKAAVDTGKGFYTRDVLEIAQLFADFTFTDPIVDYLPEIIHESKTQVVGAVPIQARDKCLGLVVFNSQREITPGEFKRIERLVSLVATSLNYQRAEERVRERDERFRSLLNTATDAILGMNERFEVNIWNPAATRLFGYSASEVMGKPLHDFITPQRYQNQALEGLIHFSKTGDGPLVGKTVEVEGVHKDGTVLPLELSISAYKQGDQWFATGIIRDIRERRRQESIQKCLHRVSQRLTIRLSPQQIGPIIAEEVRTIFRYHAFGLYELDWEKQQMIGLYNEDTPPDGLFPVPVRTSKEAFETMNYKAILEGRSVLDNRQKKPSLESISPFGFRNRPSMSLMFAPILWNEKPIGYITVQSYDRGAFSHADVTILEAVANQVGGAFHRARTEEMLLIQQTSIEQSPISIVVTDTDGGIMYVNPAFTRITEYTIEEVRGKNPRVLQSGHHTKAFYKKLWDTIKSGQTWRGEILNKRKNGELFWESVSISPVKDRAGTVVRFVAVKEDITQQKKAHQALVESEEKFRTLFEESRDAIYISDEAGHLIEFNKALTRLLGYSQKELKAVKTESLYVEPEDRKRFLTLTRKQGYVQEFPTRLRKKSGEIIHVRLSSIQRKTTKGTVIQGIIRDVTEAVRHQKELEAAMLKAQVADRVKTLFLANMSHEIRTPLNSLLGFMEVVEYETRSTASAELAQIFDSVHASGNRIIKTIHEILDISTIEAGGFELHPKVIHLTPIIRQIIKEMTPRAVEKKLYLNFQTHVRNDQVNVDVYSIQQAIMNLVDNGLKYTKRGGVTVEIRGMGNNLVLTVKDTGIGMSQEYQTHMWDIFSQESTGYTKKYQGVGLGMALVKRYCNLNNVDIDVFSEKGVGSTFTLTFKRVLGRKIIRDAN